MSRRGFDELSAYRFEKAHTLEAWCPDSDLLAMVTETNDLDIYRADWSIHRSIHLEGKATSLVWRPDGKVIAVGLATGKTCFYHYRDGSMIRKIEATTTPPMTSPSSGDGSSSSPCHGTPTTIGQVDFLRWDPLYLGKPTERIFPQETSQKSILPQLPQPAPLPLSVTAQRRAQVTMFRAKKDEGDYGVEVAENLEGDMDGLDEYAPSTMNALFISDDHAQFYWRFFAGFQTELQNLTDMMKAYRRTNYKDVKILDASVQLDLGGMTIVARGTKLNEIGSDLLQITLDSDTLYSQAHKIRSLGVKVRPIQLLLKYLKDAIAIMDSETATILRGIEIFRDDVKKQMEEKEDAETPEYAFLMLFTRYIPTDGLMDYLTVDLRQDGLQKWATTTEAAYANILKVIADCYMPCCERLQVHLNDLYGYKQRHEGSDELGVDESLLDQCGQELRDHFRMAEFLKQEVWKEMELFGAFKSWLATIINNLAPSDAGGPRPRTKTTLRTSAGLAKYIQSLFSSNGLRKFFEYNYANMSNENPEVPSNVEEQRQQRPHGLMSRTFSDRAEELQRRYMRIFQGLQFAATQSIEVKDVMVLSTTTEALPNVIPRRLCTTYIDEPNSSNIWTDAVPIIDTWHYTIYYLLPEQNQGETAQYQSNMLQHHQQQNMAVNMFVRSILFSAGFVSSQRPEHQQQQHQGQGEQDDQQRRSRLKIQGGAQEIVDISAQLLVTGFVHLQLPVSTVVTDAENIVPARKHPYKVLANWRKKGSLSSVHLPTGRVIVFDMEEG
ncbi:Anaphase-promoting complex subunit 4 [Gryganskiella cystojenkinii]|nr:Anaphase-promoting complex subunit 4 [Gryganskiella cystojenkinii]